jgi:acyl-CoA thioesterase
MPNGQPDRALTPGDGLSTVARCMSAALHALAERLVASPYGRFVGIELDAIEPGRVRLRLAARDDTGNRNGSLHGGVTASLLDVAGMVAARSVAPEIDAAGASTIDLAVHFLAPVVDEAVVVDGTVTRRGREIVFVEAGVTTAGGTPIARSVGAVRLSAPSTAEPPPSAPPCPIDATTPIEPRRSGSAFTSRLGVMSASLAPGHAVLVLPARDDLTDGYGAMHEGALAALVDCAGGAAAWSVDGYDPRGRAATIGMHLCYDRTPRDEDVVVEARTSWRAAGIFLNTVVLSARTSGRPVATGSVTYRIARP